MDIIWYHLKAEMWTFYWFMNYTYEINFRKIIYHKIITIHIVLSKRMWLHSFRIRLKVPNSYDRPNRVYSLSNYTYIVWIELESKLIYTNFNIY